MHCPECGQEILAGSEFCGNCGAPVTRQQAGPVCANCGSPNQPGAEFCAECGARLGGEVMPMQSFCPECGAAVKEGAAFCKECGADLNAATAPAPFVCPECGEPLDPDAAFCGNCGQVLQQGGEYAPAPATTAMEYQPSYPPESQDYSPQQGWVQPQTQDWECSQQQAQYPPQGQQQGWTQQQPQGRDSVQSQQKGRKILTLLQESRKMLMAAAAAVVLLVIGITGFWKPGYLLDLFRPTAKLENGMLALNDITLDFKQTNLKDGAATLTTVKDKEEEIQKGLIGDLYVMKIDKSCQGKVTVAVPVPKEYKPGNNDGLYIKLGVGGDYVLADGKTTRRYRYFDVEIKDGKAVAVIEPVALAQSTIRNKTSVKPAEQKPDLGEFTENIGFFWKQIGKIPEVLYGESYQYSKGHFRLWYDYNLDNATRNAYLTNVFMGGGEAQNLLSDLEEAYNYYKTHGYAKHVDTYTPIDVYITRLDKDGEEGDEGGWDPLSGNIQINESSVFDKSYKQHYEGAHRTNTRTTIYHEFFHAVQQSLLGYMVYASNSKKSNWFDEATATHFERIVKPNEISHNGLKNFYRLWEGPIPEESDDPIISGHDGYGRGLLIDYISSKLGGDDWIKACYENWSADCNKLKSYMKQIAPSLADFSANFYMEVVRKLGPSQAGGYYTSCQKPSKEDTYLSAIRLQMDDKTKEKIANGEEDAFPVVFTAPSFELGGYGGHVVALVSSYVFDMKKIDLTENFPDKCQLKLETEGDCRIQVIKFKGKDEVISSNDTIIKDFKGQIDKGYKFLVLVTSARPAKQNVVLKATLEKEDLKEGIYNGKLIRTQGKKTWTYNNRVGVRLTKEKDGRWGLNLCHANGDYMGSAPNVPLTYDAKQKVWTGHRKYKEDYSSNPKKPKEEVSDIHCTMKVNMEGKEPILIVDYKVDITKLFMDYSFSGDPSFKVHFEGKWSSDLKGKVIGTGKITILE